MKSHKEYAPSVHLVPTSIAVKHVPILPNQTMRYGVQSKSFCFDIVDEHLVHFGMLLIPSGCSVGRLGHDPRPVREMN